MTDLAEKYRPRRIEDFVGLGGVKKVLGAFLKSPYAKAFLFTGPPGTGKTSAAHVMESVLKPKYPTYLASEKASYATIRQFAESCEYATDFFNPGGKYAYLRIDEIDAATATAQRQLLALLDEKTRAKKAIFVFTSNTAKRKESLNGLGLEPRLTSRCLPLNFDLRNAGKEIEEFLADVWQKEGGGGNMPNWNRVMSEQKYNLRGCLQRVEHELLLRA